MLEITKKIGWWFQRFFYFHPYLGKIPILTNIFQLGWNHQLDDVRMGSKNKDLVTWENQA